MTDGLTSPASKRLYSKALADFFSWHEKRHGQGLNKATVQAYRAKLESDDLAQSSVNVKLSAIRKLAVEAADNGLLDPVLAGGIANVKGVKRMGQRVGNLVDP